MEEPNIEGGVLEGVPDLTPKRKRTKVRLPRRLQDRSKYQPHNGAREMDRRKRNAARRQGKAIEKYCHSSLKFMHGAVDHSTATEAQIEALDDLGVEYFDRVLALLGDRYELNEQDPTLQALNAEIDQSIKDIFASATKDRPDTPVKDKV